MNNKFFLQKKNLIVLLLLFCGIVYANPYADETFPWKVTVGENNAQLKNYSGNYFSSVLTEIPSGTELVAIKPALFTGWVIVDYNGYHGCVNKHQLIFEKSLAGDPKYDKLKKAEEASFRNDIIMIGVGVLVAFIILICCVKYGRGTIRDIGVFVFSLLISLLVTIVLGIAPPLLMIIIPESSIIPLWLALVIVLVIYIPLVLFSFVTIEKDIPYLSYVLFNQIVKVSVPAFVAIIFISIAGFMDYYSWEVSGFWGGLVIFLFTSIGIAIAAAIVKIGLGLLFSFRGVNIINGLAFCYLGLIMGITIFNASENVCSPAAWIALIGLIPGGYAPSEDPFPLDIYGQRAKETSPGNYVTEKGIRYQDKDEKEGWGRNIVKKN